MAFEDQTDEDFFDKLVDDEFTVSGSQKISRDLSNLSLVDGELVTDAEDRQGEESAGNEVANESELSLAGPSLESSTVDDNSEESLPAVTKDGGVSGTGVKEVQWSAFHIENLQSEADFFGEDLDGPVGNSQDSSNLYSSFIEKPGLNLSTSIKSSEQNLDSHFYGTVSEPSNIDSSTITESLQQQLVDPHLHGSGNQQITDNNDPTYWEILYPGWKYDYSSGQWYQIDNNDTTLNSLSDSYDTKKGVENKEVPQDGGLVMSDGVGFDRNSSMSYLQQTSHSFSETVEETSTSESSQQNLQYPANMVFDSQYPGWYYDTISQQWYTLDSYTQTAAESRVNGGSNQLSKSFADSGSFVGQDNYADSQFNEGQAVQTFGDQYCGTSAGTFVPENTKISTSSYASQNLQNASLSNSNQFGTFNSYQQTGSIYGSYDEGNYVNQHSGVKTSEPILDNGYATSSALTGSQGFVPKETSYQYSQHTLQSGLHTQSVSRSFEPQTIPNYSQSTFQSGSASFSQPRYVSSEGRSSAGRPPYVLVTFGFGGKLIVVENGSIRATKMDFGSQGAVNATISILNLMDVVGDKDDSSIIGSQSSFCYFQSLCKFPGPLVGGSAATKDVNKWIDERISSEMHADFYKTKLLKLLLSLLKIVSQHYGKLRSSIGADPLHEETEGPEASVARLFASARKDGGQLGDYASVSYCLKNFPSETQIRAAAVDVQNLLISGRRKEAVQRAQEGYLWGPALVLAAQLGDKFYVETVKRMAHQQFIAGTPLRTLCLLIAGQPADVFSADSTANNITSAANTYQHTAQIPSNSMLDSWEENLAVIAANRTKGDELVITHLGDCLWRERGEVCDIS